jgi:hypothetical protein
MRTDNTMAKRKRTNNDLQNITQKTKDRATHARQIEKNGGELRSFRRVSSSFSTCGTCCVNLIIPPLPEGGGGYTVLPLSFCPSKIFFVAFFSVTVDGRNLIFGHKHHIGIPYCG